MMEKIKKFINARSKLSLLVFLVSIIVGILLVFEGTSYSEYIRLIADGTYQSDAIIQLNIVTEFNIFVYAIFIFICLFNIVGYIYNNSEFMFISTGLYIVLYCLGIYMFDVTGMLFMACLLIINLLGYMDQVKLAKNSKNS